VWLRTAQDGIKIAEVTIAKSLTIHRWELGVATLGGLFALIYLVSNTWGVGLGLLFADALWLLTRIEIVEQPGAPGRYATLRGRLGVIRLVLLFGVYAALFYGLWIIRADDASRLRVGVVAEFALAGFGLLLLGELKRSGDDMVNWVLGARAERRVGRDLERLREHGWFVLHGYKRDWGGDIDHVVCGPHGAYMIETKSYKFRSRDLRRAAWNAAWLKEKLGLTWVTAVLCVDETREASLEGKIWVMGHEQLLPWLEGQRNAPVDPEAARRALTN